MRMAVGLDAGVESHSWLLEGHLHSHEWVTRLGRWRQGKLRCRVRQRTEEFAARA